MWVQKYAVSVNTRVQAKRSGQHFLKRAQEFYIEAALEIRKHFPIGDPEIEISSIRQIQIMQSFHH